MVRWSLIAEYFSLFIISIIFIRYYGFEWKVAFTPRRKLFLACLMTSAGSTMLNIFCVYCLNHTQKIPVWFNMTLNTLYFLVSIVMCSLFALFLFLLLLEHVYDDHCRIRAQQMLLGVTSAYVTVVLTNPLSRLLFYFDEAGLYQRGPLNALCYTLPLVELALLVYCYFRNRNSVGSPMLYVMRSLPPLVLLICALQIFYPEILLNGTLSSCVSLVLFLSFQTHTGDRDGLTGIRNRENFITEMTLRMREKQGLHIICVSLQGFSDVNLRYGHALGNALLYEAARYLDRLFPNGHAFRISNVTFALVLPWVTPEEADTRVSAISDRFAKPWILGDTYCTLSASMADLHCLEQGSVNEVMEQMEFALAEAKTHKRFIRFDRKTRKQLQQKKELIATMRRAIRDRQFQVWYQPAYCCLQDKYCSAEALLRLSDQRGLPISPAVFVPLAEETGMIEELTWIVLEEVCRLLGSGELPDTVSISLNLSMQQLLDQRLADRIRQYLDQYSLPASRLKIEITERFMLHDVEFARRQLDSLRRLGLEIYMDDFGTGYSNLSNVLDYPFTLVKLDRSLIQNLPADHRAEVMVRHLTDLFHDMDKRVVAEGVESGEQARLLQELGADMIQGFHFASPMPKTRLIAFFAEKELP